MTLSTAVDDQIIPALHHNELVEALLLDIVPRNASRVATTDAGQLGTSLLRWLRLFVNEVLIGTTSNNLKIHEGSAGQLWVENPNGDSLRVTDGTVSLWTNSVKRFEVTDAGINWTTIADLNIPQAKFAAKTNKFWDEFSTGYTGGGWTVITSHVFTATVGKRVFVDVDMYWTQSGGATPDIRLYVNTVAVKIFDNIGTGGPTRLHFIYEYTAAATSQTVELWISEGTFSGVVTTEED